MYWLLGLLCAVPGYLYALGINIITNDILVYFVFFNFFKIMHYNA